MSDTITVTDNRTGQQYELPISENTINASDLAKIRVSDDTPGCARFAGIMSTSSSRCLRFGVGA